MSTKLKSTGKPAKNTTPAHNDLFHLAENVMSSIGVGIYIVQSGKFVYISPLYRKFTGYSDPELLGRNSLDRIHPDDKAMVRKKAIKSLKGESPEVYEYRYIRKNGDVMWILEMITSVVYKGDRAALGSFMDITVRKKMEETMRQSEERYRTIIEEVEEGYYEVDLNGNFTFVSDSICSTLGYSREDLLGMNFRSYIPKEQIENAYNTWTKAYQTGKIIKWHPLINIRKDGTHIFVEDSIAPLRNKEDRIIGFRGITRDVTERKKMEETIRQSEERYRTIIEEMEEWYFETDLAGNFLFFNDAFARILGYSKIALTGLNFRAFIKNEDSDSIYKLFHQVYETCEPTKNFPYQYTRPDGIITFAELSIFPKRDQEGKVIGFRTVGHDITERKRTEQKLNYIATHDILTGLPNRMLFMDRLKMAMAQAKRNSQKLAVMMLDMDHFKNVNDTLGHMIGDQLLKEISLRLTGRLRQNDTISRLGGDEFIILLPTIEQRKDAAEVADIILKAFHQPFTCDGNKIISSISIGLTIYPDDCQDIDSLLKNADMAMYHVKAHGRNGYYFFDNIKFDQPN